MNGVLSANKMIVTRFINVTYCQISFPVLTMYKNFQKCAIAISIGSNHA